MATKRGPTPETLLERGNWAEARTRIECELARQPDDHWLLTQLGVTLYEGQHYRDALAPLLKSLEIVPDCPLTLWNVAGTLDALGESKEALSIYTWLLKSEQTADADECWESQEWADALKTDCMYRMGSCLKKLGHMKSAEHVFRQHISLLLIGGKSLYEVEDSAKQIKELRAGESRNGEEIRDTVASAFKGPGVTSLLGRRPKLPTAATLAGLANA